MNDLIKSGFVPVPRILQAVVAAAAFFACESFSQVNSGSDGRDGPFEPTGDTVIDMTIHPDGIFQYTAVNIPPGVNVSFIANSKNTPIVWLVQSNCVIGGNVTISGHDGYSLNGGLGGPGGFRGGNRGRTSNPPTAGQGPGGGGSSQTNIGGNASYGTLGGRDFWHPTWQQPPGDVYGNNFVLPLIGGSGGGGSQTDDSPGNTPGGAGGGGGGAILIAADRIIVNGRIEAKGGSTESSFGVGGAGSGGAVRLVANRVEGNGLIDVSGGEALIPFSTASFAGSGRVRFDAVDYQFSGNINGTNSRGFQPIILPTLGQGVQLRIGIVGGVNVPPNPSDQIGDPAVIIPGQQANPVPIVVYCSGIPLNTPITVTVRPASGSAVSAAGINSVGTQESSTARVSMNMPRGGGIIFASTVIGLGVQGASLHDRTKVDSYAQTGLTTSGERFAKMEITTTMGGHPQIAYFTDSGKRYALAVK